MFLAAFTSYVLCQGKLHKAFAPGLRTELSKKRMFTPLPCLAMAKTPISELRSISWPLKEGGVSSERGPPPRHIESRNKGVIEGVEGALYFLQCHSALRA